MLSLYTNAVILRDVDAYFVIRWEHRNHFNSFFKDIFFYDYGCYDAVSL